VDINGDEVQVENCLNSIYNVFDINDKPTHWLTGGLVGAGTGIGASAIILYTGGSTSFCNSSKNQDAIAARECVGIMMGSGLIAGGLGALIGSFIKKNPTDENGNKISSLSIEPDNVSSGIKAIWTF
jgi:hypothetical protein